MPSRNLYIPEADVETWEKGERLAGGSVSSLVGGWMREFVEEQERKEELMEQQYAEVTVQYEDGNGELRGEILRFKGEEIDQFDGDKSHFTLYECPDGYRVYVDNEGTAYLNPERVGVTGEVEYLTYSAQELVQEFPMFGDAVGKHRVRYID